MTSIDKYQKTFRLALAAVLILFTMGLDNVQAAYTSAFSLSQNLESKNTAAVPVGYSYLQGQSQAGAQCEQDHALLKNAANNDGKSQRDHITTCEVQISIHVKVELPNPNRSKPGWWKSISLSLDSIDGAIAPRPPKSKQL